MLIDYRGILRCHGYWKKYFAEWKPSFKRVKASMIVALAVVDYRRNLGNRLYKTFSKLRWRRFIELNPGYVMLFFSTPNLSSKENFFFQTNERSFCICLWKIKNLRHKNLNASLFAGRTELSDTFGQYHL